jgi:hypothetical protein
MSIPHSIAPGRKDLETFLLVQDLVGTFLDAIDQRLLGVVVNGRVPTTAIAGQMGPGQGGTGNALGLATPLDGSVTDAKIAEDANIDIAKLDQTKLLASIYLLVKGIAHAGSGIGITPNDTLHTLTITNEGGSTILIPSGPCHPEGYLDDLLNDLFCRLTALENVVGGYGLGGYGTTPYGS